MSTEPQRVVVVLGAGGSLGGAITRTLAAEPNTQLVLGDISEASLQGTLDSLPADGLQPLTMTADVGDFEQVDSVVRRAIAEFGRLDVMISNAGVLARNGRIHNLTADDWERSFRINVMGPVNAIHAAVGPMRKQKSGSIILTASVAGMTAWSHSGPYCVTKAGVIELAKVAAVEYAQDGIRVNCVCPGTFVSAMHAGLPSEAIDAVAAKHPLGLGSPQDVAGAYAYLAGDGSRWTTGAAIVVDGGYAAP